MALELHNGFPVLLVDYGSGTVRLEHTKINLNDGESHRIDILWSDKVCLQDMFYLFPLQYF